MQSSLPGRKWVAALTISWISSAVQDWPYLHYAGSDQPSAIRIDVPRSLVDFCGCRKWLLLFTPSEVRMLPKNASWGLYNFWLSSCPVGCTSWLAWLWLPIRAVEPLSIAIAMSESLLQSLDSGAAACLVSLRITQLLNWLSFTVGGNFSITISETPRRRGYTSRGRERMLMRPRHRCCQSFDRILGPPGIIRCMKMMSTSRPLISEVSYGCYQIWYSDCTSFRTLLSRWFCWIEGFVRHSSSLESCRQPLQFSTYVELSMCCILFPLWQHEWLKCWSMVWGWKNKL